MPSKPTPAEIWKQLARDARDDEEIEKLASMTGPELDKELADAGFDLDEVKADANAVRAKLERSVAERRAREMEGQARERSLRPSSRRRPVLVWLAAAVVGVVAAGGALYALTHPGGAPAPAPPAPPSSVPSPEPSPADLVAASELRRRAFEDCASQRWTECVAGLNDARRLDPAGDRSPEVELARQEVEHQLAIDAGPQRDKPGPR